MQRMARYNRWQNEIYTASPMFGEAERRKRARRLFRLDPKTLSHMLWADQSLDEPVLPTCQAQAGIPESFGLTLPIGGI